MNRHGCRRGALALAIAATAALGVPAAASAAACGYTNSYPTSSHIPSGLQGGIDRSLYIQPNRQTSQVPTITDVNIRLKIVHPDADDLDIRVSHAGKTVLLSSDNGGTGDNYTDTIFDDAAATLVSPGAAPFTGSFRPEGSLADFNGLPAPGVWTINVVDDRSEIFNPGDPPPPPQDLVYWGVEYSASTPSGSGECPTPDPICDEQSRRVGLTLTNTGGGSISGPVGMDGEGTVTDVNFRIEKITAADAQDVRVVLSHGNTDVVLTSANGGTGDDYVNTLFDDSATTAITAGAAPFTGTFTPQQPLSAFNGQTMDSNWSVEVQDLNGSPSGTVTVVEYAVRFQTDKCVDPDNDVVLSANDNCPELSNVGQENYTNDGVGDACDADDDDDTYPDTADSCSRGSPFAGADYDTDGCKNTEDLDDDGDGVLDTADGCAQGLKGLGNDTDGDGCKDIEDGDDDADGVTDAADGCALTANPDQRDLDGDKLQDACDPDDDGDGVIDLADTCPTTGNPNRENFDRDGLGDACDPDDDNDGVLDVLDVFPLDAKRFLALPAITRLKLSVTSFAAATRGATLAAKRKPKTGTTVGYTVNVDSTTTFTVLAVSRGVRRGTRCVKRTKGAKGRSCSRLTSRGTFSHRDRAGGVKLKFTGRLKRKPLLVGRYVLRAGGRNASGAGKTVQASFRIVKR